MRLPASTVNKMFQSSPSRKTKPVTPPAKTEVSPGKPKMGGIRVLRPSYSTPATSKPAGKKEPRPEYIIKNMSINAAVDMFVANATKPEIAMKRKLHTALCKVIDGDEFQGMTARQITMTVLGLARVTAMYIDIV